MTEKAAPKLTEDRYSKIYIGEPPARRIRTGSGDQLTGMIRAMKVGTYLVVNPRHLGANNADDVPKRRVGSRITTANVWARNNEVPLHWRWIRAADNDRNKGVLAGDIVIICERAAGTTSP